MPVTSVSTPTIARSTSTVVSPAVTTAATAARGNAAVATGYSSTPVSYANTTGIRAAASQAASGAAVTASAGIPKVTTSGTNPATSNLLVNGQAATTSVVDPATGVAKTTVNTSAINSISNSITATAGAPQSTGVQHDVKDAISALTAFAQSKMDNVKANIKALMSAPPGQDSQLNAAKLQEYSNELSTFESMMQMAAKMQEQEDQAIKIWVRP